MSTEPVISFIIPVFNMADTVSATLKSLLRIQGVMIEIIIVDDGSDKPVEDTLSGVLQKAKVPVRIIRTENRGRALAINVGLRHVKGGYVSFVDADDSIDPDDFTSFIPLLKQQKAELLIGQFKIIGEAGEVFDERSHSKKPSSKKLIHQIAYFPLAPVTLNAFIIKKSFLDRVGQFDSENLKSEDKDMTIRLLREASSVIFCNTFHYHYHKHKIGRREKIRKRLEWIHYRQRMISRNFSGFEKLTSKSLQFIYDSAKLLYEATVGYRRV